jgi:hypothetical protein
MLSRDVIKGKEPRFPKRMLTGLFFALFVVKAKQVQKAMGKEHSEFHLCRMSELPRLPLEQRESDYELA